MSDEATTKPSLRHKAVEELKEMLALTAYLYVCLGSIMLLKSAILQEVGISFDVWGIAIVKALVLAKFMLLGRAAKLGERYRHRPLIWPTLHMAVMFLLLLLVSDHAGGSVGRPDPSAGRLRLAGSRGRSDFLRRFCHVLRHVPGAGAVLRFQDPRCGHRRRLSHSGVLRGTDRQRETGGTN